MSQQAGWYDDPENAENLRYWDGVQWSNHISPKQKPNLEQAGRAIQAEEGWGTATPGQQGEQGYGQQGQQQGYGQPNPYAGGAQPPFQGQGQGQGQGQWQPMPGGGFPLQQTRATTPDGQPLAGWWHRLGARLIDGLLIAVVGSLIANVVVPGVWTEYLDWLLSVTETAGSAATANPPADLMGRITSWSAVVTAVGLVYEVILVTLLGGTLGKLATGLRIRLRDQPGNVGWGTSILRALIYQLSGLFFPAWLLNVLWPLWDDKRQALHDKAARTNVVKAR